MTIRKYVNVTNTLYKIIKYCIMFAVVFMTLLVLPDCKLSFRNILLIVVFMTTAYVLLDLLIPNTVVIKMQKVELENNNHNHNQRSMQNQQSLY